MGGKKWIPIAIGMENGKWRMDVGCWILEAIWIQIVLDFAWTDKICATNKAAANNVLT